jgi:predicted O-methyltransferase YrrM
MTHTPDAPATNGADAGAPQANGGASAVAIDFVRVEAESPWSREAFGHMARRRPANPRLAEIGTLVGDLRLFGPAPLSAEYDDPGLRRTPAQISLPATYGRALYMLVAETAPRLTVEAGAGYGVSGCYIAAALAASRGGVLMSFEPGWYHGLAAQHHRRFHDRCYMTPARFETMVDVLAADARPDAFFIDTVHDAATVARQLRLAAAYAAPGAMIVLDDACAGGEVNPAFKAFWRRPDVTFCAIVGRRLGVLRLKD